MSATTMYQCSPGEKTFAYQDRLPSLPLPSLSHTLEKYLQSVRPHVSDEEYMQTSFVIRQFKVGVGKELHEKLEEKAKKERNWLESWWQNVAYLDIRTPIAPFISTGGTGPYYKHYWPAKDGTQIERCALCLYYTLQCWKMIYKEEMRPEKDRHGNFLCMNQFYRIFNTCRVPGKKRDQLLHFFKTESEGDIPQHVMVLCSGHVFILTVTDDYKELLTPPELQKQMQYIRDTCDQQPKGPSVGILTAHNRSTWAELHSELQSIHPDNYRNLKLIEESIMVVTLEDTSPKNETEMFQDAIAGNPTNRWFDKSVNLIAFKNGLMGSNNDHAPIDGMANVVVTYYIDCCVKENKGVWNGSQDVRKLPLPEKLNFYLNDHLYQGIKEAKDMYLESAKLFDCKVVDYNKYGRQFVRAFNLHPDTHMQLTLQYTYYKLYGKPAPTYETGTTRVYWHGRTETIRSCTMEALQWIKAMADPLLSPSEKLNLMLEAAEKHNQLRSEAQKNQGCDRHLLGLYLIAMEEGVSIPQLFLEPAFVKSGGGGNFVLSTSFLGFTTCLGGCAAMVKDGYGCFYNIEPKRMSIFISRWQNSSVTNLDTFGNCLVECLDEMKELLEHKSTTARL